MDSAFGFYYPDDIKKFKSLGVVIKKFDTINDKKIPNVDALFIGGGFPEVVASKLSKNNKMKKSIFEFIDSGKPVYAECGGLMYLCESIKFNNKKYKMVGAIKGETKMNNKPIGRGYIKINTNKNHPWFDNRTELLYYPFQFRLFQ